MSWIKNFLIVSLAVWIAACSKESPQDCGFVQNVYGERVSWKGQIPVRVSIHESVPPEHRGAIVSAAQKWNQLAGRNLIEIQGVVGGNPQPQKDGQNVIYMSYNWEPEKSSEQGRTSIHWTGDRIREADIRLNGAYYKYYWAGTQAAGYATEGVNVEALVLHELGHVLGLKHKEAGNSVMQTYLASNTDRTQLSSTEAESIKCEY